MDGWMDGWVDGFIHSFIHPSIHPSIHSFTNTIKASGPQYKTQKYIKLKKEERLLIDSLTCEQELKL